MWKFINKVFDSEDGGFGLLVALAILCSTIVGVFTILFGG
jgi:hypothetical protein